jgi:hypothetical protein
MEWARKFFGTGIIPQDLERAMSAQQRQQMGSGALMDAGLAMLANSGYSSTPQTLGQIVAQGFGAGRQSIAAQGQMTQEAIARQQQAQQEAQQRQQYEAMLSQMPPEQAALYRMFSPQEGAKAIADERKAVNAAKARNTGSGPRTVTPGSAIWDPETGKVLYQNPVRQSDFATVDIPLPDGRVIRGQRDPQTGNVYDLNGNMLSAGPRSQQAPRQAPQNAADVIKAIESESGVKLSDEQRKQVRDGLASGSGFNISMPSGGQPMGVQRSPEEAKAAELRATNNAEKEIRNEKIARDAEYSFNLVGQLLAHPGLDAATGLSSWLDLRNYIPGTDAKDAQYRIEQLSGNAFLEAFQSLKGGGAITEIEGAKATAAMARLQRAQSDAAYREALNELQGIFRVAYERATGKRINASGSTGSDLSSMSTEELRRMYEEERRRGGQ